MKEIKILAFAGSARKDSFNKKLVHIAAEGARSAGAMVNVIDLRDFPMPLYDGDLESEKGLPENAIKLKKELIQNDGFLIASPEYNSSITPLLKNTLDWCSRPETKEEESLVCFKNKGAALMSASPGALGGLRGLVHVRAILGNIGVFLIPSQVAVVKAHEAFDPDGRLKEPRQQEAVLKLGMQLADMLKKLK